MGKANDKQISGNHYKSSIECWDYIIANNLDYLTGNAVKYLTRWKKKNGIEDLYKTQHYVEKLIETELAKHPIPTVASGSELPSVRFPESSSNFMVQLFGASPDDAHTINDNLNSTPILRPDNV
jgi:Protein of unknwon function (DUF3310)